MEIATIALILATMIASKAAPQNNGCSSVMMTLSPCLDFIGSKALEPGFSCCTTLAGIVQTDPRCLCMVLDGSAASFGIAINHTRALELPGISDFSNSSHPSSSSNSARGPTGGDEQPSRRCT
uniref:Bifunctional inhibitor/plant lipid transfer protein/seed storage helical domain-containing protein n=1 Tax=Aegilops tauschii subsp. strangulata TaxID=200361 RepID=A0A453BKP8_AEGTS